MYVKMYVENNRNDYVTIMQFRNPVCNQILTPIENELINITEMDFV